MTVLQEVDRISVFKLGMFEIEISDTLFYSAILDKTFADFFTF